MSMSGTVGDNDEDVILRAVRMALLTHGMIASCGKSWETTQSNLPFCGDCRSPIPGVDSSLIFISERVIRCAAIEIYLAFYLIDMF
jgi:hypothetical protein